MGKNVDLWDKYLTYKLTMLAVPSASRVLGLQHLDIRFMTKGPKIQIIICSLMENSINYGKKGNPHLH